MRCEISIVTVRKKGFNPRTYYEIIPLSSCKDYYINKRTSVLYLLVNSDIKHVFFPEIQYSDSIFSDEVELMGDHELSDIGFSMLDSSDPLTKKLGIEILKAQCDKI